MLGIVWYHLAAPPAPHPWEQVSKNIHLKCCSLQAQADGRVQPVGCFRKAAPAHNSPHVRTHLCSPHRAAASRHHHASRPGTRCHTAWAFLPCSARSTATLRPCPGLAPREHTASEARAPGRSCARGRQRGQGAPRRASVPTHLLDFPDLVRERV